MSLEPIDMHFGDDGNLYVATDSQKGGVVRFDGKTGEYLGRFIDVNTEVPGFNYVEGMDVAPDGDIYLSAETIDTVHRFDGKTGQLKQLVGAAFSIGRVEFGPDGNIYYCDWFGDTGGLLRRSTADGETSASSRMTYRAAGTSPSSRRSSDDTGATAGWPFRR